MFNNAHKDKVFLHAVCLSSANNNIGVLNQMKFEIDSVEDLNLPLESVFWSSDEKSNEKFHRRIPKLMSKFFLRRIYFNIWLFFQSSKYRYVLVRYPVCDPFFMILLLLKNNIITIHHSKESLALLLQYKGFFGSLLANIENTIGKISLRNVAALIAVTNDILDYELKRANKKSKIKSLVSPNGISIRNKAFRDNRDENITRLIFVSSRFYIWTGIDEILDSLSSEQPEFVELHLVGSLNKDCENKIFSSPFLSKSVIIHQSLESYEIEKLMTKCDIGISSFQWNKAGLTEGCNLMVREFLSFGLPVYSGRPDSALPQDFKYYKVASRTIKDN